MPSAAFLRGPISNTVLFTCHVFMSPCELRPAARNNSWNYCWSHFKVDSSVHSLRQHASRKWSIIKPWVRSRFLIFKDFCLLSKCFPLPRCFPLRSVRMNLIILTLGLLLPHHKFVFPFLGKGGGKGSNRQDFTCSLAFWVAEVYFCRTFLFLFFLSSLKNSGDNAVAGHQ